MATNTGIMGNEENNNLWHDVYWEFSLTDPDTAVIIRLYPDRGLKLVSQMPKLTIGYNKPWVRLM